MLYLMLSLEDALTDIMPHRSPVNTGRPTTNPIARLADREDVITAIISSREIPDIRKQIGIDNIFYAGCHGMQIEGPGWSYIHPLLNDYQARFAALESELIEELGAFKGIEFTRNKAMLVVHCQNIAPRKYPGLLYTVKLLRSLYRPWAKIAGGDQLFKFIPDVDWDKGRAVEVLLRSYQNDSPFPIYIGDDASDEPAFVALRDRGLTIHVGRSPRDYTTAANLSMKSSRQVLKFLSSLL